jgi:hypothetical protein
MWVCNDYDAFAFGFNERCGVGSEKRQHNAAY